MSHGMHPTLFAAIAPHLGTLGQMPQHPAPTRNKPSDMELLQAIMHLFAVPEWEAHNWLYAMDLDGLSDALIGQDRARIPLKFQPWGHIVAREAA